MLSTSFTMCSNEDYVVVNDAPDDKTKSLYNHLQYLVDMFSKSLNEVHMVLSVTLQNLTPDSSIQIKELTDKLDAAVVGPEQVRQNYLKRVLSRLVAISDEKEALVQECKDLNNKLKNENKNEEWRALISPLTELHSDLGLIGPTNSELSNDKLPAGIDENSTVKDVLHFIESMRVRVKDIHETRMKSSEKIDTATDMIGRRLDASTQSNNPEPNIDENILENKIITLLDRGLNKIIQQKSSSSGDVQPKASDNASVPETSKPVQNPQVSDKMNLQKDDNNNKCSSEQTNLTKPCVSKQIDPPQPVTTTSVPAQVLTNPNVSKQTNAPNPVTPTPAPDNDPLLKNVINLAVDTTYEILGLGGKKVTSPSVAEKRNATLIPMFSAKDEEPWCPVCKNKFPSRYMLEAHIIRCLEQS